MDPIANTFTTIENAARAKKTEVVIPFSKHILAILEVLKRHNRIQEYKVNNEKKPVIRITIADSPYKFKRISKLSRRIYSSSKHLLPTMSYRLVLVSTPVGVMTTNEARKKRVGGELIGVIHQ